VDKENYTAAKNSKFKPNALHGSKKEKKNLFKFLLQNSKNGLMATTEAIQMNAWKDQCP